MGLGRGEVGWDGVRWGWGWVAAGRPIGNGVMVVAELVLSPQKSAQRRRLTARPPDLPVVAVPSRVELSGLAT